MVSKQVKRFLTGLIGPCMLLGLGLLSPARAQEEESPEGEVKTEEVKTETKKEEAKKEETEKEETEKEADEPEKDEKAEPEKKEAEKPEAEKADEPVKEKEATKESEEKKDQEKKDEGKKDEGEGEKKDEKAAAGDDSDKKKPAGGLLDILKLKKANKLTEEAKKRPLDAEAKKKLEAAIEKLKGGATAVTGAVEDTAEASEDDEDEDGEDEEDDEEAEEPEEPKEPVPPMFWLRDGTRLAGFPKLRQVHVETAYGKLTVPVSEITRVRFASVQKKELVKNVHKLIEQLGHEEYDLREQAMEELRQLGVSALELLREAQESDDEEIKSRVEKLIGEFEEDEEEPDEDEIHTVPIKGDEDEVVTLQFTVKGRVLEKSFEVATLYGNLTFHREDIISIVFQEPLISKRTVEVPGTAIAGQKGKWVDTQVELAKGEPFEITASGTMQLQRYNVPCGPEGTSNAPARFEKFPAGALVGRIGESGKAFLVGADYKGEASDKGKLYLAIAMRSTNGTGKYEVEIETEDKEKKAKRTKKAEKKTEEKTAEKTEKAAAPAAVRKVILKAK